MSHGEESEEGQKGRAQKGEKEVGPDPTGSSGQAMPRKTVSAARELELLTGGVFVGRSGVCGQPRLKTDLRHCLAEDVRIRQAQASYEWRREFLSPVAPTRFFLPDKPRPAMRWPPRLTPTGRGGSRRDVAMLRTLRSFGCGTVC